MAPCPLIQCSPFPLACMQPPMQLSAQYASMYCMVNMRFGANTALSPGMQSLKPQQSHTRYRTHGH